jgi:Domain of unknown function (DUF6249)
MELETLRRRHWLRWCPHARAVQPNSARERLNGHRYPFRPGDRSCIPMDEDILAIMIPLVGVILGCSIPIVFSVLDYRKRKELMQLHHKERMAAIERGIELPPLPDALLGGPARLRRPNHLLRGLIWTLGGLGFLIALRASVSADIAAYGYIPIGIGVAYLIYYGVEGRKLARERPPEPGAPGT